MPGPRIGPASLDSTRIGTVLDGLTYPAATWQLVAHADHYGADVVTRAEIHRLPAGTYPSLAAVITTLEQTTSQAATLTDPASSTTVHHIGGPLAPR